MIEISNDLLYGKQIELSGETCDGLLGLICKVTGKLTKKEIYETFTREFSRARSGSYSYSSDESWAFTDLKREAEELSKDGVNFLRTFFYTIESLRMGHTVPPIHAVAAILGETEPNLRIANNALISNVSSVPLPQPNETTRNQVAVAMDNLKALVNGPGDSSAIDRAHSLLLEYILGLSRDMEIPQKERPKLTEAFNVLKKEHPALQVNSTHGERVKKFLRKASGILEVLNELRNEASLAHPNTLLDDAEAKLVINTTVAIYYYLESCIQRYESSTADSTSQRWFN